EANIQSTIKGIANVGYYNAEKTEGGKWEDRGNEGTTWYKVENYYMAGVDGVSYYPAESIDDPIREIEELFRQLTAQVDVLKDENARLKAKLKKIEEVLNE
ncbi:MAG: hypothetical protein Q4D13_02805, partial [Erysipelotrichaceae bacterium]|nr:hypothetical protein [Erysipelotrichaceae bacterium]